MKNKCKNGIHYNQGLGEGNDRKLIEVKDLEISFGEGSKKFVAVKNANFFINKGETFSLVGESGSGKTTIGRAIIGLNDTSAGGILYDGKKINGKQSRKDENELIRKIQMIFQDPAASLNERATVDYIISEGLINHHLFNSEERTSGKSKKILCMSWTSSRTFDTLSSRILRWSTSTDRYCPCTCHGTRICHCG